MRNIQIAIPGIDEYFTKEAFRSLRTNLQFCGEDAKLIAITSCSAGEGKSTVALHLAKSLSEIGKKVLLIDADIRRSVMAERVANLERVTGLSEILTAQDTFLNSLCSTQYENLFLLFAGNNSLDPTALLNTKYFNQLIDEVRTEFEYIIIDTPALGLVSDAAVITSRCDGALIVVGTDYVKEKLAQEVVGKIKNSGCRVLGIVRNRKR